MIPLSCRSRVLSSALSVMSMLDIDTLSGETHSSTATGDGYTTTPKACTQPQLVTATSRIKLGSLKR
jgi:hypothetical protein